MQAFYPKGQREKRSDKTPQRLGDIYMEYGLPACQNLPGDGQLLGFYVRTQGFAGALHRRVPDVDQAADDLVASNPVDHTEPEILAFNHANFGSYGDARNSVAATLIQRHWL